MSAQASPRPPRRALLLAAAAALVCAIAPGVAAAPAPPAVSITRVDGISMEGRNALLDLTLGITNPNGLALPLHKLRFQLQFNSLDIARGESTSPVTIQAQGSAQVPVRVDVDSATLLALVATLPPDGTVDYRITGSAEIGLTMLRIPFSDSGTVRLALQ